MKRVISWMFYLGSIAFVFIGIMAALLRLDYTEDYLIYKEVSQFKNFEQIESYCKKNNIECNIKDNEIKVGKLKNVQFVYDGENCNIKESAIFKEFKKLEGMQKTDSAQEEYNQVTSDEIYISDISGVFRLENGRYLYQSTPTAIVFVSIGSIMFLIFYLLNTDRKLLRNS